MMAGPDVNAAGGKGEEMEKTRWSFSGDVPMLLRYTDVGTSSAANGLARTSSSTKLTPPPPEKGNGQAAPVGVSSVYDAMVH